MIDSVWMAIDVGIHNAEVKAKQAQINQNKGQDKGQSQDQDKAGSAGADKPPAGSKPIDKTPWSGDQEFRDRIPGT
jgi:hypothetical protein